MPSKTETISKTKAKNAAIAARTAALPKIPKDILDRLVTGTDERGRSQRHDHGAAHVGSPRHSQFGSLNRP